MQKLSKSLMGLSERAAKAEANITAAQQENKEKRAARRAETKAKKEARQAELDSKVSEFSNSVEKDWNDQKDHFQNWTEKVRGDIEVHKSKHDLKQAQKHADKVEENALNSIYFAELALVEAEESILDAIDARFYALSLEENSTSSSDK